MMKNKKQYPITEFFVMYGWPILAVIISMSVLIYSSVFNIPQEQFSVYKEECEKIAYECFINNETKACEDVAPANIIFVDPYIEGQKIVLGVEECEEVEVDEIEYNIQINYGEWCSGSIFLENETSIPTCYKKISKQDLTTEWLNENAECVEYRECPNNREDINICLSNINEQVLHRCDVKEFTIKTCLKFNKTIMKKECQGWMIGDYTVRKK